MLQSEYFVCSGFSSKVNQSLYPPKPHSLGLYSYKMLLTNKPLLITVGINIQIVSSVII